MNNKILFADLDHTLLCDDKSISEKNRAAIQKMLERGHYFVLATGRPVESGRIVAKDLGLTSPGCYMIAFNGAVIYDCAADRVLYKSALPIEVAQEIFDRAHKAGIYAQTYNTVDIVTKRHTKELDYYVANSFHRTRHRLHSHIWGVSGLLNCRRCSRRRSKDGVNKAGETRISLAGYVYLR